MKDEKGQMGQKIFLFSPLTKGKNALYCIYSIYTINPK